MSFFKKLFGGGGGETEEPGAEKVLQEIEHKGFTIRATPFKTGNEWQTCGTVSKEAAGEVKSHRFIRADRFGSADAAADIAIAKGRQLVDEQGERVFG